MKIGEELTRTDHLCLATLKFLFLCYVLVRDLLAATILSYH